MDFGQIAAVTLALVAVPSLAIFILSELRDIRKREVAVETCRKAEAERPDPYEGWTVGTVQDGETAKHFFNRCIAQKAPSFDVEFVLSNPPDHWGEDEINHFTRLMVMRILQLRRIPMPLG